MWVNTVGRKVERIYNLLFSATEAETSQHTSCYAHFPICDERSPAATLMIVIVFEIAHVCHSCRIMIIQFTRASDFCTVVCCLVSFWEGATLMMVIVFEKIAMRGVWSPEIQFPITFPIHHLSPNRNLPFRGAIVIISGSLLPQTQFPL